ncbi:putative reverse transcriptase zinc-binding domain-containing protein [Helianthus anomalus]
MLQGFSISNVEDKWSWDGDTSAVFSVAGFKALLEKDRGGNRAHSMKWEGWVPIKVNMVSWRAEFDRLPTRGALTKRRINIVDVSCPLCETGNEEVNHLLVGCGFSYGVWSFICKWCNLDPFFAYDVEDLMQLYRNVHGDTK